MVLLVELSNNFKSMIRNIRQLFGGEIQQTVAQTSPIGYTWRESKLSAVLGNRLDVKLYDGTIQKSTIHFIVVNDGSGLANVDVYVDNSSYNTFPISVLVGSQITFKLSLAYDYVLKKVQFRIDVEVNGQVFFTYVPLAYFNTTNFLVT